MAGVADDDVVDHFQLQDLARADEISGDSDVRLRRLGLSGGMIMLCDQPSYVRFFHLSLKTSRFDRFDQTGFFT